MTDVGKFYDKETEREWNRLERHRMEFAVNLRIMQGYMPPPRVDVLDIGGGPGRYAIELADKG